jgi:hypothetical protein
MEVKNIWTEIDFEVMGWHDSRLYSIKFPDDNFQLKFDIDYIFQWIQEDKNSFKFWISPSNLIFNNVNNLKINIDFRNFIGLTILDIERGNSRMSPNGKITIWDYVIETDNGVISFSSTGFQQEIREQPVLSNTQYIENQKRI